MFNYVVFEIKNVSPTQIINRLFGENVKILSLKSKENSIILSVSASFEQKTIVLFDALCYNYKIVKKRSARGTFEFLLKRCFLFYGIILLILGVTLMPHYIFDVRVSADDVFLDDVSNVLSDFNIRRFTKTSSIDIDELSLELNKIEGVSFSDVSIEGSVLVISLKKAEKEEVFYDK